MDFRGFKRYELGDLRQINLLVGKNNCGKTSILEAVHLLESKGNPHAIMSAMMRRGEVYREENESSRSRIHIDVMHLFRRNELPELLPLRVASRNDSRSCSIGMRIIGPEEFEKYEAANSVRERFDSSKVLLFEGDPPPVVDALPLSRREGVSVDELDRMLRSRSEESISPVSFVTTETQSADFLARSWEEIALTEEEDLVLEALQVLEPGVERIAVLGDRPYYRSSNKNGVIVRMKGEKQPLPLGSMGDGMWRMLTLILATLKSAGGILLVDEIDTGLHHTAIIEMWRLIVRTAIRLDVQVFATTHSLDCVTSLANAITEQVAPPDTTTIQRVEKERPRAIAYSENEIVIAANRGTEMR